MLALAGTAQYGWLPLSASQVPAAKQKPHPASTRPGVSAQGNQPCVHRESWSGQNLSIENHWLAHLPGQSAHPVHHSHGHAESSARLASRSLAGPQAQDLHRAHRPRRGRAWVLGSRSADLESLLPSHFHPSQPKTVHYYHYEHSV